MHVELLKTFRFDAAHYLPFDPEGHKCRGLHGHSYRVDIHVAGEVDPDLGWLIDFAELKKIIEPIVDALDHQFLGDIEGLENSTSELLAEYLWNRIQPQLPILSKIALWESDTSCCIYCGK